MRRARMEVWLMIAAAATSRALKIAMKRGDIDTVRKIKDAAEVWVGADR